MLMWYLWVIVFILVINPAAKILQLMDDMPKVLLQNLKNKLV